MDKHSRAKSLIWAVIDSGSSVLVWSVQPQAISNEGECDPKDKGVWITDRSEEKRKANEEKKKQACITTSTGQKE